MGDFLTFALVSLLVEAPYLQKKEADEHSKPGQQRKGTLTRVKGSFLLMVPQAELFKHLFFFRDSAL